MIKASEEWLKQADYDIKTAKIMFDNKRHFYAVFMCHLSIELGMKRLNYRPSIKLPMNFGLKYQNISNMSNWMCLL